MFLACLSPRYAVSDNCCKELSLADLLHKPVVPVMLEKTPWPPPGPVGLLLAQRVYVDLAGEELVGAVSVSSQSNQPFVLWCTKAPLCLRRCRWPRRLR